MPLASLIRLTASVIERVEKQFSGSPNNILFNWQLPRIIVSSELDILGSKIANI
ncbi:hypothetical protein D3C78_1607290 [compost metagenome]